MAACRLPIGYRFKPSKKQLLGYFLTNKLSGQPLPSSCPVLEYDVYSDHPLNILAKTNGGVQEDEKGCVEGYFFTRLKKTNRDAKNVGRYIKDHGTWSGKSKIKNVYDEAMTVVGYERYFKFAPADNRKNEPENEKEWKMHEYSLSLKNNEFVLCHITNKVESSKVGDNRSRALKRSRNEYSFMGSNYEIGGSSKCGREEFESPQECASVSINNPAQHDDVHQAVDYGLHNQQYIMPNHGLHQQYIMPNRLHQQYVMPCEPHQQYAMPHEPQQRYTMPNELHQQYVMPREPHQQYVMPHEPQQQYTMPNELHQQYVIPRGHGLQDEQYAMPYGSGDGHMDTTNEALADLNELHVGATSLNYSLSECVNDNMQAPQEDYQIHEVLDEQAASLPVSVGDDVFEEISDEAYMEEIENMLRDDEVDDTPNQASIHPPAGEDSYHEEQDMTTTSEPHLVHGGVYSNDIMQAPQDVQTNDNGAQENTSWRLNYSLTAGCNYNATKLGFELEDDDVDFSSWISALAAA